VYQQGGKKTKIAGKGRRSRGGNTVFQHPRQIREGKAEGGRTFGEGKPVEKERIVVIYHWEGIVHPSIQARGEGGKTVPATRGKAVT